MAGKKSLVGEALTLYTACRLKLARSACKVSVGRA